jgi:hydrogenase maturation factor
MGVYNKKFKCSKCHFRSNRPTSVSKHFKIAHWQVTFNDAQCIQVLDEEEATRTLAAYERNYANKSLATHETNHVGKSLVCKPYKCRMCEFRTAQKASVYFHMKQVHNLEIDEARTQVEVLPFDEAEKSVEEYNNKFAQNRFTFLQEIGTPKLIASDGAITSEDQPHQHLLQTDNKSQTEDENENKKFICVKCHFRSNWQRNVLNHFKRTHRQVSFNPAQCVQSLDEEEAARTLAAYEKNQRWKSIPCKPFKCGKCEYRAALKSNAYSHMRRIHHVEFYEVKRLVKVLSLDEARKTVKEYNLKFGKKSGRYRSYNL